MLAETLDVSTDFIYQAVQRDEIPHIRLGTNIRFHYKDILGSRSTASCPGGSEERMAFKRKGSPFYWTS